MLVIRGRVVLGVGISQVILACVPGDIGLLLVDPVLDPMGPLESLSLLSEDMDPPMSLGCSFPPALAAASAPDALSSRSALGDGPLSRMVRCTTIPPLDDPKSSSSSLSCRR